MAAERPQTPFKRGVERIAELSQKFDIPFFIIGGIVFVVHPTIGTYILLGNAGTFIAAEGAKRWARRGKK